MYIFDLKRIEYNSNLQSIIWYYRIKMPSNFKEISDPVTTFIDSNSSPAAYTVPVAPAS